MPKIIVTSRYLKSSSKKKLSNYVKYIATREGVAHTVSERENYVGYLANRPGAVKFDSHGLFSQTDEPIVLDRVAKEVANHKGNVWTHVVSLRRDDAQKMGYESLDAWRNLIIRQIPNIAKQSKIDMKNIRWYAAFHDKKTNPHVHIIVYSTDEREGFLTNHGIEKIRSGFANDIYADELHHLYEQQTDLRNLLKKESEQLMKKLAEKIYQNKNFDAELMNLVAKLHTQLSESKGRKVYGYLKSDVKKTVDEIFLRLADNDSIKKMYELWCEMEQQKHDVYSSAKIDFPALTDNEEFRSVKNMIIQTVMGMEYPIAEFEFEQPKLSEHEDEETLIKYADTGDAFSCYKLGMLYLTEEKNDIENAVSYFEKSASQNMLSSYQLGKLYLCGADGVEKDKEKALQYFNLSAEQGNEYAQNILDNMEQFEHQMLANTLFGLFINLSCCIEDDYQRKFQSGRKMIDSKLRRMMQEKKQSLGIKQEHGQVQEY